ncbi:oligosaccharide flippase family protein [Gammaproteobacteria bacterium]|nr:oligosaccharide flippase family protein [Gammaproteobacteria bacterium]
MIKEFLFNSFIYSIGNILTRGISFFLVPLYTRYLTPEEYGLIDFFMIFGSIISLTIALEINQAVVRFYQDAETKKEKMQIVSSAFVFTILVYFIYLFLSLIYSNSLTVFFLDDIAYKQTFIIASMAIASNGLFFFTSGQLRWQILPKQSVAVSIIHLLILASVASYLLIIENLKVDSIFIAQIVANIIGTLMSIYFTRENYRVVFVYKKFIELISFSYPLVLSSAGVFVSLYIDRIIIKELLGMSELGIYGVACRFAAMASIIMFAFQSSLTPLIYKNYKSPETPRSISKLFDFFVIFAITFVCGSFLFSKDLIMLMTTKDYYYAAFLIPQLVIGILFANMYLFAPGLAIAKRVKTIASVSVAGACINAFLNIIMIPSLGLMGASLATMLSSIIAFSIHALLSQKFYFINFSFAKKIILFVFCASLSMIISLIVSDQNIFYTSIKFFSVLLIMLYISYALLSYEDYKKIKNFIFGS